MELIHKTMESYNFPEFNFNDISIETRLGKGASGEVFTGELYYCETRHKCIIKKFSSENYSKLKHLYNIFKDEIEIGHLFIGESEHQIQFYGYSVVTNKDNQQLYLLMEQTNTTEDLSKYLSKETFWNSLTKDEYKLSNSTTKMYHDMGDEILYWDYKMNQKDKLHLIMELSKSVEDLHKFNVAHCDLKPQNMIYTGSIIKIIDFGASMVVDKPFVHGACDMGTCGYMPPELSEGIISLKNDIYSLGVCMLEIWFGDIWPMDSNDYKVCRKYVLDYLHLLHKDNSELHKIVKKCIHTSFPRRPTIKTIIRNLSNLVHNQ